jgi:hypothetical protein
MHISLFAFIAILTGPGSPVPELFKNDQFLLGHWQCEVSQGQSQPLKEVATYSLALDGKWLLLNYRLDRGTKDSVETTAYEGYDPRLRKWVYTSFASDGTYGTSYSDGWSGNTKIYRPAPSDERQFLFTATRENQNRFRERVDVPTAQGSSTIFDMTCRRG